MAFRLNDDRVAVLADEVSETTEAGLFVPDSGQNPLRYGVVMVVGSGRRSDTGRVPIDFLEGERVFFHKHSGQPMEIEGVTYVVLAPAEIIGTVIDTKGELGAVVLPWQDDSDGGVATPVADPIDRDERVLVGV
jgi:chaperonin GroES